MEQKRSKKKERRISKKKNHGAVPSPKAQPQEEKKRGAGKWFFLLAVVWIITFGCYFNSLNNQYVFDDLPLIQDNISIQGIKKIPYLLGAGKSDGAYRPVRMISYAIDYSLNEHLWQYFGRWKQFEGLNPLGYHVSNIVYHIITSFFLFLIIYRLAESYRIAFLAASLFLVHPVHTDSVTYLSGRRDILFTLFYLAGFYFFLCYRKTGKVSFIIGTFAAYLLSLGSKEMGVTLPAILFCYDLVKKFPENTKKINFSYFKELFFTLKRVVSESRYLYAVFFAGALACTWYKVFLRPASYHPNYYGDSIFVTFFTVGKILVHYIWLLLYPVKLNADYSFNAFPLSSSFFEPATFCSFIVLGFTGYAVLRLLGNYKPVAFGIIWFFVTLLPVCHIFPHHELMAEHYLYLPSAGFCLVAALLMNRYMLNERRGRFIWILFIAVVFLFSARIIDRNRDWRDELTLWKKTVETSPQCARGHNNLGFTYVKKGRVSEAIEAYKKAILVKPNYSEARSNLGAAYGRKRMYDEAITELEKSIDINPSFARAHDNLGNVYQMKGELDKAIIEYKKTLEIKPDSVQAHSNLGTVYARKGMYDEAIAELKKALSMNAYFEKAYYNLGNAYIDKGMPDEGISELKNAVTVNPRFAEAYHRLASVYYSLGDYPSAISYTKKARALGGRINPKLLQLLRSAR